MTASSLAESEDWPDDRCVALFRAVVQQSFTDAMIPDAEIARLWSGAHKLWREAKGEIDDDTRKSIERRARGAEGRARKLEKDRREARVWLLMADPDGFTTICDAARLDPSYVRQKATRLKDRGWSMPVALAA